MPDATPTSTAPPSRPRRSSARIVVQIAITAVVLAVIGVEFARQWTKEWSAFRSAPIAVHPRWALVALASIVYLAGFTILIETWRRMIVAWGERVSLDAAARVWAYSNLVRYLPGNTFLQIPAFAELSRRQRVAPVAAAGAAAINTIVNIVTGFVVALAAGWQAFDALSHGRLWIGVAIAVVLAGALAALPAWMPALLGLAQRLVGRELVAGVLPRRALYLSVVGNVIAWIVYGLAFRLFVAGVLGAAPGSTVDYVAVYSWAYVIGYLAFAMPAGLGVREGAVVDGLAALHLVLVGPAAVVAVCARLWTTILELIPALIYFARAARRRPHPPATRDGSIP